MNGKKEREIFAASLDQHVEAEGDILDEYRTLAGTVNNGPIGVLIDLILTEEERHHLLLRKMANRIRSPFEKEKRDEPSWVVDRDELRRHTRKLREHEQQTINTCRSLKSQIPVEEVEFFDALLDALILDSEKHRRLLLAVEKLIPK